MADCVNFYLMAQPHPQLRIWSCGAETTRRRGAADVDPYIERCRCCSLGWADMCEAVPKIYTNILINSSVKLGSTTAHVQRAWYIGAECREKHCPKVSQAPDENKRKQDLSVNLGTILTPEYGSLMVDPNDDSPTMSTCSVMDPVLVFQSWHPYREIRGERVIG